MIPSLLLLSASVVASPVIVSEVKATREAGHLRVEVRGDGGIDPEAARTRIDQGSLYLFLGGARVRADNRAWKLEGGAGEIRAHRHHTETELDVPLLGNGCSGPVELQGTPTGLTALVGCEAAATAPARALRPTVKDQAPAAIEEPLAKPAAPLTVKEAIKEAAKAADKEAPKAAPATEAAALKNLVALPPAEDEEADQKTTAKDTTTVEKVAAEPVKAPAEKAAPARVEAKADDGAMKAPAPSFDAPAAEPTKTSSVAPSGFRAVGMPALFLAGLAIAAYVFARKKRGLGNTRRIQILETASLGQKRSLVIARVGDETLVLGASEAGITLLQSGEGNGAAAKVTLPAAAPVESAAPANQAEPANEMDQSLIDALADVPEPEGIAPRADGTTRGSFRSIEGGLASLFGRKAAATAAARVEPKAGPAATFDDILEDSVEDQELRRKLAAGMSARTR